MNIKVFQSDKGDCLLLEAAGEGRILCDGGMPKTMQHFVRKHLENLHLDLLHVSHIDQDHIAGVLQLLEDKLQWKVFRQHGENSGVNKPDVPEPGEIDRLWHNGFRAQIEENVGPIEALLANSSALLLASQVPHMTVLGADYQRIALSITEALKVSRLAKPDLLDIKVNALPGDDGPRKLLMRRPGQRPVDIGDFRVTIVGPTKEELNDLRTGWNNWLETHQDTQEKIERFVRERIQAFENGHDMDPFDLHSWNGVPSFKGVTAPNVASLVLLIEEGEGDACKRVLITGDAQQDILLKHLKDADLLEDGHLHLDVLKVQHHGSEHNTDKDFCRQVSADHYVFCGNGANSNPELDVIEMYYKARIGPAADRAQAPEAAERPFQMHFSTHSSLQRGTKKEHMHDVEALVERLEEESAGRLTAEFNRRDFIQFDVA